MSVTPSELLAEFPLTERQRAYALVVNRRAQKEKEWMREADLKVSAKRPRAHLDRTHAVECDYQRGKGWVCASTCFKST